MRLMSLSLAALLAVAAALASIARAQDCANASDQSTMNACADQAFRRSDGELNTLYGQIRNRLKGDADAGRLLVAAQRAWLGFRDAECAFSTSAAAEGSVYPMLTAQCRDGLTKRRVEELRAYLRCQEGDLSCPVPGR